MHEADFHAIAAGGSRHGVLGSVERFDIVSTVPLSYIAGCDIGCVVMALLFVALRLYLRVRRRITNSEDILVVIAWTMLAISMSLEVAAAYIDGTARAAAASGEMEENEFYKKLHTARKLNWLMKLFYHVPLTMVKYAWIRFYYVLVPKALVKTRLFLHFTLFITLAACIVTISMFLSACNIPALWGTSPGSPDYEYCTPFNHPEVMMTIFAFHALSEIFVYTIPLCVIYRLRNITIGRRISVTLLFILGFFCLFLMIFNVWLSSSLIPRYAFSYNPVTIALFWPLEPAWAIVVFCLPACRVLLDQGWKTYKSRCVVQRSIVMEGSSTPDLETQMPRMVLAKSIDEDDTSTLEEADRHSHNSEEASTH